VAIERLSDELAEAGAAMTRELDSIGLEPQGALWMHSPALNDWRYCVVSDLVSELGRPATYNLIGRALDVLGRVEGLTIFDIHLFDPNEVVPMVLAEGGISVGGISRIELKDINVHGLPVDALIYRLGGVRSDNARKKSAREFQRRVTALA
jgi:hypothetical protein